MSREWEHAGPSPGGKALIGWLLTLALGGLALNFLLVIRHFGGGGIAGCGGGSACEELLNSRWSQVFGIPVAAFGMGVYMGLLGSFTAKGRCLRSPCLGLVSGAAAWFVFVQAVMLGRFCPWCMIAHAIGIGITLLGLWRFAMDGSAGQAIKTIGLYAVMAVIGIAGLQVYGPRPVTHRIDEIHSAGAAQVAAVHDRGSGRKVEFDGGRKVYDVSALPHLGRAEAPRVMVEYFDYSCTACQTMCGFLEALIDKHPADICVVVLPVPMEHSCNHALGTGDVQHPGSCELAKIALAVWRVRPAEFGAFHKVMLDEVFGTADARAKALELIPQAELEAAMHDPWIDELIQADINDWVAFSGGNNKLPKLLITGKRILHGLPSGTADFIRVMERELGL